MVSWSLAEVKQNPIINKINTKIMFLPVIKQLIDNWEIIWGIFDFGFEIHDE